MTDKWDNLIKKMQGWGVQFTDGLTETQLQKAESVNNFRFPPDLHTFLSRALPISVKGEEQWNDFYDWRTNPDQIFQKSQEFLLDGILFDVEFNKFWPQEWGQRPAELKNALAIARAKFYQVPVLIPIYSHRFIPAEPHKEGNLIFSIVQTDIICYGANLENYFYHEFSPEGRDNFFTSQNYPFNRIRQVPFWGQICS